MSGLAGPARRYLLVAGPLAALLFAVIAWVMLIPERATAYTVEQTNDQQTGQLTVSPTKYEMDMEPGDTTSRDVVVVNRTGQTLTVEFSTEDFEGSDDPAQATVFLGDEDSKWGARHWLEPEVDSIVLRQGESLTMKVKVEVPEGAEPGGHYASLFASTTIETKNEDGTAVDITSRLGCLFLIRVAGQVVENGSIDVPEVPGFSEYGPVEIGIVFNNTGNVHSAPSGRVVITNFLGQTVAEIPVKEWVVLPEASRRTLVEWNTRYQFGRYTVRAEIQYGPDGTQLIASRSFWIVPWKIILAGAAALVLVITMISIIVRKRRSSRRQLEDEVERLRGQAGAAAGGIASAGEERDQSRVALNELFPSMDDSRTIDLSDEETQKIVRELIEHQLDLARAYIGQGAAADARRELLEARSAAQRAGWLSEVGNIDDMLRDL